MSSQERSTNTCNGCRCKAGFTNTIPFDRLRFRARQMAGKMRRFYRANVYTAENEQLLARRQGDCTRCGACCKILFQCPFLIEHPGNEPGEQYTCGIYGEHFNQCRIFPLVPKDLEEIEEPCGYTFVESD